MIHKYAMLVFALSKHLQRVIFIFFGLHNGCLESCKYDGNMPIAKIMIFVPIIAR